MSLIQMDFNCELGLESTIPNYKPSIDLLALIDCEGKCKNEYR